MNVNISDAGEWTAEDAKALEILQAKKAKHDTKLKLAVERVAGNMHSYNMTEDDLVSELIIHAADVCEALAPFVEVPILGFKPSAEDVLRKASELGASFSPVNLSAIAKVVDAVFEINAEMRRKGVF